MSSWEKGDCPGNKIVVLWTCLRWGGPGIEGRNIYRIFFWEGKGGSVNF